MKFRLFGERVVVQPIEEDLEGSIVLPNKINKQYDVSQVIAIGDGKVGDKQLPMFVEPMNIVLFQRNPMLDFSWMSKMSGKHYLFLHQGDIIAKLTSRKITIDSFQIAGHWVLLETFNDIDLESKIVVPQSAEKQFYRFRVKQIGSLVTRCKIGEEVAIEKSRASVFHLDGKELLYILDENIMGIIED